MEEQIILDFQVNTGDAFKELERTKKALIDLKKEQADLNKAYKEGAVTLDEYVEESVRQEQVIKQTQGRYNDLSKAVNTVNNSLAAQRLRLSELTKERNNVNRSTVEGVKRFNELNKQIKQLNNSLKESEQAGGDFRRNVGNYTQSIEEAAGSIQVAGVSVGDLSGKLAGFANPATAAIGLLTSLATAYLSSAAGARDFENASNQLNASFKVFANDFAASLGAAEGEGILSRLTNVFITRTLGFTTAAIAKVSAEAQNRLKELEVEQLTSDRFAKEQLDRAEEFRRIRDDETKTLEERFAAAKAIETFINNRENELVRIQQERLRNAQILLGFDEQNLELQAQIKQIQFEIADIEEDSEGKRTEALNGIKALEKEELERGKQRLEQLRSERAIREGVASRTGGRSLSDPNLDAQVIGAGIEQESRELERRAEERKRFNDLLIRYNKQLKESDDNRTEAFIKNRERERAEQDAAIGALAAFTVLAQQLGGEQAASYKVLATGEAIISTYTGAARALKDYKFPISALIAAQVIALGLTNVARINDVGFASGGYTGDGGKYEPAGIVHRGEYVIPKSMVQNPKYSGVIRSIESDRLGGYADGGLVTNTATSQTDSNLLFANAIKNIPAPEVSVKEFTRVQNRVRVKENISRV